MKPIDIESIKKLNHEELVTLIQSYSASEQVPHVVTILETLIKEQEELQAENKHLELELKKLRRSQGFDLVKGKRLKPVNYIPGKDKI